jgi:hypothetical protein
MISTFPAYWQDSPHIRLHQAIDYYFSNHLADRNLQYHLEQTAIVKAYFLEWLHAGCWDGRKDEIDRLRLDAQYCQSLEDLDRFREQLIELGIDPL